MYKYNFILKRIFAFLALFLTLSVTINAQDNDIDIADFTHRADAGDADAQYELGKYYYVSNKDKDSEGAEGMAKAFKYASMSANQKNAAGEYLLSLCYLDGYNEDHSKSMEWLQKAADQGYAEAQEILGFYYDFGDDGRVAQNYSKAVEWYQKAANQGNVDAQRHLGICYECGTGVARNYANAYYWFKKAADQGTFIAELDHNDFLEKANSDKLSINTSDPSKPLVFDIADLISQAAAGDAGAADAQYKLGKCYYEGNNVEKNGSKAFKYASMSANQRNAAGENLLGSCYCNGIGVAQNYFKAVEWYQKAADQSLDKAQYNLGCCYDEGEGVVQNYADAYYWYKKAADQGNKAAIEKCNDADFLAKVKNSNEDIESNGCVAPTISYKDWELKDKIYDTEINEQLLPEEKINNDSIIRKINETYYNNINSAGYTNLTSIKIKQSDINSTVFPIELVSFEDGYTSSLWLDPPSNLKKFYQRESGLISFDFMSSYELTNFTAEQINMITPSAFVSSIKSNQLYIGENEISGLMFDNIPEISCISDSIKDMNALIIASNRDNFIAKLLKVRNKYIIANTLYINTKFELKGNAYFDISNYDINNQLLYIYLSIDYWDCKFKIMQGLYIATITVSVPLKEATQLFIPNEKFYTPISFTVQPGASRKGLGITGGGVSCWKVPNMIIVKEPQITVFTKSNYACKFNIVGMKGKMWSDGLNTYRWDLHKIDLPSKECERDVNGIFLKQ